MKEETLKQWQNDVDDYDDNAYLMYEYYDNNLTSPIKNNKAVDRMFYLGWFDKFRRKQSAELPFDLERAKSGDCFYIQESLQTEYAKLTYSNDRYWVEDNIGKHPMTKVRHLLRMKYPPKVKK